MGSGKWRDSFEKHPYYWGDPFLTSMIKGPGGGNSDIFYVHPYFKGKMNPI